MTSPTRRDQRLYTIPAGVPFAVSLATGIRHMAGSPEALARFNKTLEECMQHNVYHSLEEIKQTINE